MSQPTNMAYFKDKPDPSSGFVNAEERDQQDGPGRDYSFQVPNSVGSVVKTADYTATAADAGKRIVFDSATAVTLKVPATVPAAPSSKWPADWWGIEVVNIGDGSLTVDCNGLELDGVAANVGPLTTTQGLTIRALADASGYTTNRGVGGNSTGGAIRKVGLSLDGNGSAILAGSTSSVQLDFSGTIVGWSIEADQVGSITVEVAKKAGTQTSPQVPKTAIDKISASAPITLSSAQAAGADASGVSTWSTAVSQWDSIKFNITSAATITAATVWISIQQG